MHQNEPTGPKGINWINSPILSNIVYCDRYVSLSYTMAGVRKSLNWTQSDSIAEAVSAESCHIVLETSPADYVEKISRYLESSVGQIRQDKADAESDSGDSLFITQKPVPEAVRTGKRHRHSSRYTPASPRDLEESEDDTSSSASHGESTADKKRQRKKFTLPKYTFPFLTEKKPRSTLFPVQQNTRLHNATMGGFFKCVRELWQGYGRGEVELSLPTLDMDGDYISPLSEKEEEKSEDEDIKVVEKKRFVAPSKAKCSQLWYTPTKRDDQVKQERKRRRRTQESQRKMPYKMSTKATISRATLLSSDADRSDSGHPQREMSDKHVTSDTSVLKQAETPKRRLTRGNKKILLQEKESEEDSDATVCELLQLQGSLREHTQGGKEATVTVAQADVFQTDNLSETGREEDEPDSQSLLQSLPEFVSHTSNDCVCTEATVMKKRKVKGDHASLEEGRSQSQEERGGLHAAASVNVEAEETLSPHEDSRAEPPALQTWSELELNEKRMENSSHDDNTLRQEERDFPDSTPAKKKRKRSKSTADNIKQEVVENLESGVRLEDSGFSMTSNMENVQEIKKKKKKKLKRNVEDDESVEPVDEPLNDDSVMQNKKKKKKKKKEKRIAITEEHEEEDDVENTEVCQETLGSRYEKKRRKHETEKQSSSLDDTQVGEEDGVSVSLSNEGVALEESTGPSVKKKKKRESISEGVDICYTPDKSKKVENTANSQKTTDAHEDRDAEQVTKRKKKKKREKTSELSSRQVTEDTVAQSGDPGTVRKKEKKRPSSCLGADSEEKDAQSYQQQKSSSKSVAAHVWDAGKAASYVEAESAQTAVNSGDGVSKKKKKRKRKTSATRENVEEDHKPDFQELNKTCASAFTDTGVKRKKKPKTTESEHVILMERSDSAADEGQSQTDKAVMPKKKKKKSKGETCQVIQESPPAASEEVDSERAAQKRRKKDKQLNSSFVADGKYDHSGGSTFDQASKETLSFTEASMNLSSCSETHKHQAFKGVKDKKKKKKNRDLHSQNDTDMKPLTSK